MENREELFSGVVEGVVNKILKEKYDYTGNYINIRQRSYISGEVFRVMSNPGRHRHDAFLFDVNAEIIHKKKDGLAAIPARFKMIIDPAILSYIFSIGDKTKETLELYLRHVLELETSDFSGADYNVVGMRIPYIYHRDYDTQLQWLFLYLHEPQRNSVPYSYIESVMNAIRPGDDPVTPAPSVLVRTAAILAQGASGGVVRVCGRCFVDSYFNTASTPAWGRSTASPYTIYPVMLSDAQSPALVFVGNPGMTGRSTYESRLLKDDNTVDLCRFMEKLLARYPDTPGNSATRPEDYYRVYVEFMKKVNWRYIKLLIWNYTRKNL